MSLALLDVDGTLVDTNYQHTLAWYRAFCEHDIVLPVWRIHRHIGMGGDQLVPALTSEQVEREHGDDIREAESRYYRQLIDEVRPTQDARRLIEDLHERGHTVLLASSAKQQELDHYLQLLDARDLVDGWTSSTDVQATKPAPDIVQAALDRAGADADDAVMIGDSPWDAESAARAGVGTIAVMTGGFSEEELKEAGASAIYQSVAELRRDLDRTSLR
jgi:HAD superfamily hydrolase (TIGR01509 family)